jgi:CsoR family transcriptional regulator, copper-sensing transcriptional repressor
MKIKDLDQKKRVTNRLRRIEWQLRGVIQMIEDEEGVREIIQQLSAVRSALGQAVNEEILCAIEKSSIKAEGMSEKDMEEIREFLKIMR